MFIQKLNHPGDDLIVGIFHHVMTRLFYLVDLGIWEILFPSLQKIPSETKILHTPDDQGWTIPEVSQLGFNMLDHGVTRDVRRHGNILHKPQVGNAVFRGVVGCQISFSNLATHASWLFAGPGRPQSGKQIKPQNSQRTNNGVPAQVNTERDTIGKKGGGVEKDEPFDFIGMPHGKSHSDRPTPVVDHQSYVIQVKMIDQACQVIDVLRERVVVLLRLVGQSATHMIRHHTSKLASQSLDEVAVIKRPGGIAVEHKERIALPFIKVMQAVGAQLDKPGFEGI